MTVHCSKASVEITGLIGGDVFIG